MPIVARAIQSPVFFEKTFFSTFMACNPPETSGMTNCCPVGFSPVAANKKHSACQSTKPLICFHVAHDRPNDKTIFVKDFGDQPATGVAAASLEPPAARALRENAICVRKIGIL
jgi:hypothetical protein